MTWQIPKKWSFVLNIVRRIWRLCKAGKFFSVKTASGMLGQASSKVHKLVQVEWV